jgi:CHAD domain-containing protein
MLVKDQTRGYAIRDFILRELVNLLAFENSADLNAERLIHNYRKALKRCRAMLRLIRYCMSEFSYEHIYGLLSSASTEIEEKRDSIVLVQIFSNLIKGHEEYLPREINSIITEYLVTRVRDAYSDIEKIFRNNEESAFAMYLKAAYCELYAINLDPCTDSDVQTIIEKSYYTAANLYYNSRKTLDPQVIHKWRKSCKHLLLQMKFAPDIDSGCFQHLINALDHLTDMLGTEHDLSMLENTIRNIATLPKEYMHKIYLIITKERSRLQKLFFKRSEDLFSETNVRSFRFVSCN